MGAIFWQAPSQISPSVVALLLMAIFRDGHHEELIFRLVLASGILPAVIVFVAAWFAEDSKHFQSTRVHNPLERLLRDNTHKSKLIAGGGSWFLYDVAFFGTTLFTP